MTQQEALQEAQRRWSRGSVRIVQRPIRWQVGQLRITDSKFRTKGSSRSSWEAAFADADRKQKAGAL